MLRRRMSDRESDAQARVYLERADEYDALISAEDADGRLRDAFLAAAPFDGARVVDVGAGTGRLSRWLTGRAARLELVERAAPMLDVARRRLEGAGDRARFHVADARALPLEDASVDHAVAGWVFGHFRHWMPDGWREEVDQAIAEMRRVVKPGGAVVILETLGTGHDVPRTGSALDVYFEHLEAAHGFTRAWHRSDYVFDDVEAAARVMGGFFGESLVARIREEGWTRVPECTALLVG